MDTNRKQTGFVGVSEAVTRNQQIAFISKIGGGIGILIILAVIGYFIVLPYLQKRVHAPTPAKKPAIAVSLTGPELAQKMLASLNADKLKDGNYPRYFTCQKGKPCVADQYKTIDGQIPVTFATLSQTTKDTASLQKADQILTTNLADCEKRQLGCEDYITALFTLSQITNDTKYKDIAKKAAPAMKYFLNPATIPANAQAPVGIGFSTLKDGKQVLVPVTTRPASQPAASQNQPQDPAVLANTGVMLITYSALTGNAAAKTQALQKFDQLKKLVLSPGDEQCLRNNASLAFYQATNDRSYLSYAEQNSAVKTDRLTTSQHYADCIMMFLTLFDTTKNAQYQKSAADLTQTMVTNFMDTPGYKLYDGDYLIAETKGMPQTTKVTSEQFLMIAAFTKMNSNFTL